MSKETSSGGGIGFLGMLTILFIGLKLGEVGVVAEWSWWWVLAPTWIPIVLVIGIFLVIGLWVLISSILKAIGI